jgi:branched-subunit amino acid transport protein
MARRTVRRLPDSQAPEPGRTYLDGVRAAAPIGVAALAFGVSFGVLARAAGMGRVAPVVMSVTTFAGSAQFAVASILGAGGGLVTAIVAAVLLNLRYGPIGLSAATAFEGPWWRRVLTAQMIVDESWAVAQRDDGRIDRHLLIGAGLLLLVCWTAGTAIGAFAGDLVAGVVPGPALAAGPRAVPPPGRPRRRRHRARPHALHRPRGPDRRRQPGLPDRREAAAMNAVWISVIVVGLATIAIKAAGPLLLARRSPPPRAQAALEHLAPALLAALVVTQALGGPDGGFAVDARLAGLAAGAAALLLRAPLLVVITAAAVTAALVRLIG